MRETDREDHWTITGPVNDDVRMAWIITIGEDGDLKNRVHKMSVISLNIGIWIGR